MRKYEHEETKAMKAVIRPEVQRPLHPVTGELIKEWIFEDGKGKRHAWIGTGAEAPRLQDMTLKYSCLAYPTRAQEYLANGCKEGFYGIKC